MTNTTNFKWGYEILWADLKNYSAKCIIIKEGDAVPFGYHKKREKTIMVLQGLVQLILEKQTKLLQAGETYHFPPKILHQLCAVKGDATILECGTELLNDFVEIKT